jgi:hypothetical protein
MAGSRELKLTLAEIETYLEELGNELATRGFQKPLRAMLIGGAFMLSQIGNRNTTGDVDVVLLDYPPTTDRPIHATSQKFRAAISAIGTRYQLGRKWCNDDADFFLQEFTEKPLPGVQLWKAFGMLHVYLPPIEYILVCKLVVFRPKDYADIETLLQRLRITTRQQALAILQQFVPDTPSFWEYYELEKTLRTLFDDEPSEEAL